MNATQEQWRPVPGYEGFYEVSSGGRVRSLDRRLVRAGGMWTLRGRDLKPTVLEDGRCSVAVHRDGKDQRKYLHILVLETFVGPRPQGMKAHHFDDDPGNNTVENLRWDTVTAKVRVCLIPQCDRKYLARGMCQSHYNCLHFKGVPLARYMAIWRAQNEACGICCEPHPKLFLDHDHACCPRGQGCGRCARGLLCPSCNNKMAALDDPAFMEAAPRYLAMKRMHELSANEAAG